MIDTNVLGKVALFGAAGAIGHALAPVLDARSIPYRVIGRDIAKLQREFPGVEAVGADLLTGEGVDEAATGINTIVYLAGAPYTQFDLHPHMIRNALIAAKCQRVSRFIHVAPVYSYGPALSPVSESAPHAPTTKKGRYRLAQEDAVLCENGNDMRTLLLQLPDFYGPFAENTFANYYMTEATDGKPATFIGPMNVNREFVFVPDVAEPLLELASLDDVFGRYWNLGGFAPITGAEVAKLVWDELGKPERSRSVSKWMLQLFGMFNPMMREFVEMYYLYDSGFILDDSALRARLGNVTKTSYEVGIRKTLEWIAQRSSAPTVARPAPSTS